MLRRRYGNTEDELSILGFGGILVADTQSPETEQLVGRGIEAGINYFDVAPSYGNAEERLGPALAPYRKDVFLACKTTQRQGDEARKELESSLRNMRTDYFDLYQLHAMTTREDFDQAVAPGGVLEMVVKARQEGLVRYVGFSAHSAECAVALLDYFDFNSVLFPFNWAHFINENFGPQVLDKAAEKGAACLALKALAYGKFGEGEERSHKKCWYRPIEDRGLAELALRFTLSQSIVAALPPGAQSLFEMALELAEGFTPITASEVAELEQRASEATAMFKLAEAGGFAG